jgi:hypothetical protein
VDTALNKDFGRIQSMMFMGTVKTDTNVDLRTMRLPVRLSRNPGMQQP